MLPHPILIAGPSASGKTTLAKSAAKALQLPFLSLDDYFVPNSRIYVDTPSGKVRTFERPELYDAAPAWPET